MVSEIALVDVAHEQAYGEALDLRHGASLTAFQKIYSGGLEAIVGSDIVVITAGISRKADESRLDLTNRNAGLFQGILDNLKKAKLSSEAVIVVVSNPVDIMTQLAVDGKIVPPNRVIGLGTLIDTTRFRSLLAEHFKVDPMSVSALVLGEHGDSMVPIWSAVTIQNTPLAGFPGYDEAGVKGVFELTKKSGAEMIRLKRGACYAVGLAIREIVHSIMQDKRAAMPVSALQQGAYGISGICLSLPTVIGRSGVIKIIESDVADEEREALHNCGNILKSKMEQLA